MCSSDLDCFAGRRLQWNRRLVLFIAVCVCRIGAGKDIHWKVHKIIFPTSTYLPDSEFVRGNHVRFKFRASVCPRVRVRAEVPAAAAISRFSCRDSTHPSSVQNWRVLRSVDRKSSARTRARYPSPATAWRQKENYKSFRGSWAGSRGSDFADRKSDLEGSIV